MARKPKKPKPSELLSDPSKWTKHQNARDASGIPVSSNAKDAVKWCVLGALNRCGESSAAGRLRELIPAHPKFRDEFFGLSISAFNDDPHTTHDDILTLLLAADL